MNGQTELDTRLNYERDLKDNLMNVARFAGEQQSQEAKESGHPLKKIESKQEAYGIAAQRFVKVCTREKQLNGAMKDFLKLLDTDGKEIIHVTGIIYNVATELAQETILMAAQASRILGDLYYEQPKTMIEEFLEAEALEAEEALETSETE